MDRGWLKCSIGGIGATPREVEIGAFPFTLSQSVGRRQVETIYHFDMFAPFAGDEKQDGSGIKGERREQRW